MHNPESDSGCCTSDGSDSGRLRFFVYAVGSTATRVDISAEPAMGAAVFASTTIRITARRVVQSIQIVVLGGPFKVGRRIVSRTPGWRSAAAPGTCLAFKPRQGQNYLSPW